MATGSGTNTAVNAAAGPVTIAPARAGYYARLIGFYLAAYGAGQPPPDGAVSTVTFVDGAGNTLSGPYGLRESMPFVVPPVPATETDLGALATTAAGASLMLNVAGAAVSGTVSWRYDAV